MLIIKTLEPVRDKYLVRQIADYLLHKGKFGYRNSMIWLCGVYLGLRITDLLELRVSQVNNLEVIEVTEKKTHKIRYVPIPKHFKKELQKYIENMPAYRHLFLSQRRTIQKNLYKSHSNKGDLKGYHCPITRQQYSRILDDVAVEFGLSNFGCHTMRKTYGYFLYKECNDIYMVKEILNHSDIAETKRYIGILEEDKRSLVDTALNF